MTGDCSDGSQMRKYPWDASDGSAPVEPTCGNALANFDNCVGSTTAVGSYSPAGNSPYGAKDMAGNVWEWVHDWHASSYPASAVTDPQGPGSGSMLVDRGGCFNLNAGYQRASRRDTTTPGNDHFTLGLRCCRSLP